MNAQVGKWGNSLAVRIPGTCARELGLVEASELELTRVDGGLFASPPKREYRLDELLEQITPQSIHGETDWVGRRARGVVYGKPLSADYQDLTRGTKPQGQKLVQFWAFDATSICGSCICKLIVPRDCG